MASQSVAGVGVKDAAAQEGSADEDVENVKHGEPPGQQRSRRVRRLYAALHTVRSRADSKSMLLPLIPRINLI
jgi:hypothetical protein